MWNLVGPASTTPLLTTLTPAPARMRESLDAIEHMSFRASRDMSSDEVVPRRSEPMQQSAPSRIKKSASSARSPSAPPPAGNIGDVGEWLGPWWQKRNDFDHIFTEALTNFRPIQIRNFLREDKALLLHRCVQLLPCCVVRSLMIRIQSFKNCPV